MNAVFKFIPIDQIMTPPQDSNVLKLASRTSTAATTFSNMETTTSFTEVLESTTTVTEANPELPQIPISVSTEEPTTTVRVSISTPPAATFTEQLQTTIPQTMVTSDSKDTPQRNSDISTSATTEATIPTSTEITSSTVIQISSTSTPLPSTNAQTTKFEQSMRIAKEDIQLLQSLLGRSAKNINIIGSNNHDLQQTTTANLSRLNKSHDAEQLLQALLLVTGQNPTDFTPQSTTINHEEINTTTVPSTTSQSLTSIYPQTLNSETSNMEQDILQEDSLVLQSLLGINAKNTNGMQHIDTLQKSKMVPLNGNTREDTDQLLQDILLATGQNPSNRNKPTSNDNRQGAIITTISSSTTRSREEDLRQYEEDTKLLKALLQATGQNRLNFNVPSLKKDNTPRATTVTYTSARPTTTSRKPVTTTPSIEDDLKKFQEDAKLLQALLQATGHNPSILNIPALTEVTSNVRKPATSSNPTTALPSPVYIPDTTTIKPQVLTTVARTLPTVTTTFQPRESTTSANVRISTTNPPGIRRKITTTTEVTTRKSNRNMNLNPRFTVTAPSSSTFSPQEDLAFLKNLVS